MRNLEVFDLAALSWKILRMRWLKAGESLKTLVMKGFPGPLITCFPLAKIENATLPYTYPSRDPV